eukprot:360363-Chlamydomonas_euryale.AAC.3
MRHDCCKLACCGFDRRLVVPVIALASVVVFRWWWSRIRHPGAASCREAAVRRASGHADRPADSPADRPCRQALQTGLANRPCRQALQTGLADRPCRRALQTGVADRPCRRALQTGVADRPCRQALQTGLADRPCRQAMQMGLQISKNTTPGSIPLDATRHKYVCKRNFDSTRSSWLPPKLARKSPLRSRASWPGKARSGPAQASQEKPLRS